VINNLKNNLKLTVSVYKIIEPKTMKMKIKQIQPINQNKNLKNNIAYKIDLRSAVPRKI
jgi:hypothetical protein